jgi:hypothetical protein
MSKHWISFGAIEHEVVLACAAKEKALKLATARNKINPNFCIVNAPLRKA